MVNIYMLALYDSQLTYNTEGNCTEYVELLTMLVKWHWLHVSKCVGSEEKKLLKEATKNESDLMKENCIF
jgi:hypothetical protein